MQAGGGVILTNDHKGRSLTSGHNHTDGAPSIPMIAAQWLIKPKWLDKHTQIFCVVWLSRVTTGLSPS